MARPFKTNDAKWLISRHKEIIDKLNNVIATINGYYRQVEIASEKLIKKEILKVFKDIPIEEVNREKKGIRIRVLKDHGYNTIADIAYESKKIISSMYGIGEVQANAIKTTVDEMILQTRKQIKVKISTDNKTKEITDLIISISKYKNGILILDKCNDLFKSHNKILNEAFNDVNKILGFFKWIFASKKDKLNAEDAYNYLFELKDSEYFNDANLYIAIFNEINNCSSIKAWEDFEKNPVSFFNVLEEINPEMLGNDDTLYGLPQELALKIKEGNYNFNGLHYTLRRYQTWGVKYILSQERVLLGDEMGLGKTVQAIATMVALYNEGATHFLVICPASIIINWIREVKKMSILQADEIHGYDRLDELDYWLKNGGVAVTNYESAHHIKLPDNFRLPLLVVDEAHYIKNPHAKRTINVKKLSTHADRILFMTGTPLENKVDEMVNLIRMLQPQIATKIKGMEFLSSAPIFQNEIAPVYYRRKRVDVLMELPDLIESQEWCALNIEEEIAYEKAVLSGNLQEARRVSWNVDNILYSSKANRLKEIVEDAKAEGRKVIVYSFFLNTLSIVKDIFKNNSMDSIQGSVPIRRRQEIIDEFDKAPAGTVLPAQIQSGGTGLNIQSASVVVICEPQFKPSTEKQAISRAYRMGQTRNVHVHRLLCENTVDERIMDILYDKDIIFQAFADESVAAKEAVEIDMNKIAQIMDEEIKRINAKYH